MYNERMKYFLLVFITIPVYACKVTPEAGMRKAEEAARLVVTKKTKRTDLLAKHDYPFWYVRSTKPTCVEYKVGVDGGKDCKMTGRILGEKPCK